MSGHGAQPRSNQGWFLWREENWSTQRKTLEAQENQQTHLTYDVRSRNLTQDHSGRDKSFVTFVTFAPLALSGFSLLESPEGKGGELGFAFEGGGGGGGVKWDFMHWDRDS